MSPTNEPVWSWASTSDFVDWWIETGLGDDIPPADDRDDWEEEEEPAELWDEDDPGTDHEPVDTGKRD
jgi:hypothetical protein